MDNTITLHLIFYLFDINLWAATFCFLGTILIFLYGLPLEIDKNQDLFLVVEDYALISKIKRYSGLILIIISFLFQIVGIIYLK